MVNTIKKSQIELKKINPKYQEQNNYITDLRTSILQYAVQGKLVVQNPKDEPVSELLKRIKAEKEQLIKDGKIKKEKPLPLITQDEIPYDLPQGWEWVRLGNVSMVNGGYAFKSSEYKNTGIRVVRISDFNELGFVNNNIVRYDYNSKLEDYLLEEKNIILCMTGGTVGKSLFIKNLTEQMVTNQRVGTIKILGAIEDYINYSILSPLTQQVITESKNSTNDNISIETIKNFLIPLPPLAEQKRIVANVDKLMQICEELEIKNSIAQKSSSELFQSILQNYFTQKESSNEIIDLNFKRAVLSAKIINEMHEEKYFGAVKLEKILYLCETHLGITLNGKYKKEAAGPYDAKSRYEVEDILKIKKWFDVQKETNGSVEITKYLPLENCHEIKTLYNDVFAGSLSKIDKLMDLFKGKNSDFCESIATLYAVWKNRLNNNLTCSNSELIADFKMWSKSKERFYDSDLLDRILFMRRKGLTPDSNIKK